MLLRFLLALILVLAAEYYSLLVVRSTTRSLAPSARQILLALYWLATLSTWIGLLFFRRIDWASLPPMGKNIYVAYTIGLLVGKLLILVVMVGDELRRGLSWLAQWLSGTMGSETRPAPGGLKRSRFLMQLALFIGITAVGGFLYGITNRYNYRLRRLTLSPKGLPKGFRGMKMVQISDIHAGSFDNREAVQRGLDMIRREKPDLIVFTGDLVNNISDEMLPYQDLFAELRAPLGVYSVLGNHDYGDYHSWENEAQKQENLEKLIRIQKEMGWTLLRNEHVVLKRKGDSIGLIGVENWSSQPQFPRYGDLKKARKGTEGLPYKILLSHDPSHWEAEVIGQYPDIGLTLAGHTHGMQFGVEIPGIRWSPAQLVYRHWAGLYEKGHQALYVNRGFGFLGYAGRLGILPEITVVEFR